MTGEGGGGGGDVPANDNVEVADAANDNVEVAEPANDNADAGMDDGGAGGEGPNEGGPTDGDAEPASDPSEPASDDVAPEEQASDSMEDGGEDSSEEADDQAEDREKEPRDGDGAEARDANERAERTLSLLELLPFLASLYVSDAGYVVQSQANELRGDLYEISMTVSRPKPGDSEAVRALSPKEEEVRANLEDVLEQAHELERIEKEQELGDAAPKPSAPKVPSRPGPPTTAPSALGERSRRRSGQAANDNNEGAGGDAPNETDD